MRPLEAFTSGVRRVRRRRLAEVPEQLTLDVDIPELERERAQLATVAPFPDDDTGAPSPPRTARLLHAVPDVFAGPQEGAAPVPVHTVRKWLEQLAEWKAVTPLHRDTVLAAIRSRSMQWDTWTGSPCIDELAEKAARSPRSIYRALNGDTGKRPLRPLDAAYPDSLGFIERMGSVLRYETHTVRAGTGRGNQPLMVIRVDRIEAAWRAARDARSERVKGATVAPLYQATPSPSTAEPVYEDAVEHAEPLDTDDGWSMYRRMVDVSQQQADAIDSRDAEIAQLRRELDAARIGSHPADRIPSVDTASRCATNGGSKLAAARGAQKARLTSVASPHHEPPACDDGTPGGDAPTGRAPRDDERCSLPKEREFHPHLRLRQQSVRPSGERLSALPPPPTGSRVHLPSESSSSVPTLSIVEADGIALIGTYGRTRPADDRA